ncbi:probable polyamine transporter At3g13620 [Aristolochia californica]|uniref:probable polyamine transporter At3g13620 n=1 Tax=Aristolochia californica TaxID=171875 RepID=UPI0035DB8D3A
MHETKLNSTLRSSAFEVTDLVFKWRCRRLQQDLKVAKYLSFLFQIMAATAKSQAVELEVEVTSSDPSVQDQHELELPPESPATKRSKLSLIPLIFVIYFEVSGGPYAEEPTVAAAGPFFAILGFLIFPFVWSIPEALITAELATAFPGNGGYVIWADRAFGPFWGWLMGYWKFLSGSIYNAAYPILCADYLKLVIPFFRGGRSRDLAIFFFNVVLIFLNFTGLTVVGYTAVALGVLSLLPFVLMFFISIPKLDPGRWVDLRHKGAKDWKLYITTLFWNLNFWDNASTLAGEVDQPQKTFPKALFYAAVITCLGYLIPLFSGTGALKIDDSRWSDGFLAEAASMIAGKWLKYMVEVGSLLSAVGMYEALLSSGSFQLLGTAEQGFLPKVMAARSQRFGTPWVGILTSSTVTLSVSYMSYVDIISSANVLYGLGMLLEFATFVWLRRKCPSVKRPYKVPAGLSGVACMCVVPMGVVVFVIASARKMAYIIGGALTVVGVIGYFAMCRCRDRGWMEFCERGVEETQAEEMILHGVVPIPCFE